METIVDARQTLFDKLTPTLGPEVEAALEELYADARKRAELGLRQYGELEAAERSPVTCPFSWDEICQQDWYPVSPTTEAK